MEANPISGAEAEIYLRGKGAHFINKESKVSSRPRSGTQPDEGHLFKFQFKNCFKFHEMIY